MNFTSEPQKISNLVTVRKNEELNCLEVYNIKFDMTFLIDEKDKVIFDEYTYFRPRINDNNVTIKCAKGSDEKAIGSVIFKKEIEDYKNKYNTNPVVVQLQKSSDNKLFDYRRSNLIVTSMNDARTIKNHINSKELIGVTETPSGTFKSKIKFSSKVNSEVEKYANKTYATKEDAALAYDYYSHKYFPENYGNNFNLNKYPSEYLEKNNISSLDDISLDNLKPITSHSTKNNKFGYTGLEESYNGIIVKAINEEGKREYIGHVNGKDSVSIYNAVAMREKWLYEHKNASSKSIVEWPENSEGKIVVAGIIKK